MNKVQVKKVVRKVRTLPKVVRPSQGKGTGKGRKRKYDYIRIGGGWTSEFNPSSVMFFISGDGLVNLIEHMNSDSTGETGLALFARPVRERKSEKSPDYSLFFRVPLGGGKRYARYNQTDDS